MRVTTRPTRCEFGCGPDAGRRVTAGNGYWRQTPDSDHNDFNQMGGCGGWSAISGEQRCTENVGERDIGHVLDGDLTPQRLHAGDQVSVGYLRIGMSIRSLNASSAQARVRSVRPSSARSALNDSAVINSGE